MNFMKLLIMFSSLVTDGVDNEVILFQFVFVTITLSKNYFKKRN